ncbi:hypothetical protein [Streptomyces sp. NPDC047071]|uniref:hypothetical protein n=1 Tax=Streptomyces sp. NPDC047071 TaxID=3154808 RepID=UPI003451873C
MPHRHQAVAFRASACALGHALATDTDTDRGWADLNTACCLRSWESRGAEHDTTRCTRQDQAA